MGIKITGSGHALPKKILTNDDLSKMVDTSHEWILSRTGIEQRHILEGSESLSDLAYEAAKKAVEAAKQTKQLNDVAEIDLIIVATTGPDNSFPSTACEVQGKLGASNAFCFDISAACTGFVYAMHTAECMMRAGGYRHALVIGADALSRFLDWSDRSTCVLFGDGAGAVLLGYNEEYNGGVLGADLGADGSRADCLVRENFTEDRFLHMQGPEVFKFATRTVPDSIEKCLKKANLVAQDVRHFVLHQANLRIIASVAHRFGVSEERFPKNMDQVGNTSAGSIPILLDQMMRRGQVEEGDILVLSGFGAGLTWASMAIRI